MAAQRRIAGLASFFIEGAPFTAKGGLEYKPNETKREPIYGLDGSLVGWSEVGDGPYMKVTLLDTGGYPVRALHDRINVQLVAQAANGKTVTGHSMTMMEPPAPKNESAEYECTWIGLSVVEG